MDPDGSRWILWIPLDPNGSQWIPMYPVDPDGSRRSRWIPWIPMDPIGSWWIPGSAFFPLTNRQNTKIQLALTIFVGPNRKSSVSDRNIDVKGHLYLMYVNIRRQQQKYVALFLNNKFDKMFALLVDHMFEIFLT